MLARYEALGVLLYHRPGLKEAINSIKEEGWELLLVADPRRISETETALHELVHKFSLYNYRVADRLTNPGSVGILVKRRNRRPAETPERTYGAVKR